MTDLNHRIKLINKMNVISKDNDFNCLSCVGSCCTYKSNSMMITPLETHEMIKFLIKTNTCLNELKELMTSCVAEYRLDKEIYIGNKLFRKTYTCPFFLGGKKGCSISRYSKPLGCLAFNPNSTNITNGGDCSSNLTLLNEISTNFDNQNLKFTRKNNIKWIKLPIPVAINSLLKNYEDIKV